MKRMLALAALLFSLHAHASPQLESLLAPIALQPDAVVWDVLEASKQPDDVIDAAAGRGARSPATRALLAHPELLSRMAESPQWLFDLGNAYLSQPNEVLATVQVLRHRAAAAGHLRSDEAQVIQHQGSIIAVQPAVPHHYYVRYYDPLVVYGAWRPVHHVHHWRPWAPRRVVVVHRPVVVHHHHPVVVHKPAHGHIQHRNGAPSPAVQMQRQQAINYRHHHQQYHRVPESQRQPIVRGYDGHRNAHKPHDGGRGRHHEGRRHR